MTDTIATTVKVYYEEMHRLLDALDDMVIDAFANLLFDLWREGQRVFVFGNGGSSFTASHHVLDYTKTATVDGQPRLQAISLVDNIGMTTAVSNDIGFEETFRYSLASSATRGDAAVAISASGNSPNVVNACQWAKANGLRVVALTGFDGGLIRPMADIHIHVPSNNYGLVEDLHLSVGHAVAQALHTRISTMGNGG